ncbi:hypothetical protein FB451DRAFT_1402610 [Mycena latifolia]|nr:hypothetical protein FB451DRAFT_1402610 [Mycena latifolia]
MASPPNSPCDPPACLVPPVLRMNTLFKSTIQAFRQSLRAANLAASRKLATGPPIASRLISNTATLKSMTVAGLPATSIDSKALLPDCQVLQKLIAETEDKYFPLPPGMQFAAPSRERGLEIKLGFEDPKSHFMLELLEFMGYTLDTHSSTHGVLWDVTYKPSGIISTKTGNARSHGVGEFAWHTDGSFATHPQRFFRLHVVHPDKLGGSIFRVLPAEELVAALHPHSIEALLRTELDFQVLTKFYKERDTNKGRLLELAHDWEISELNTLPESKGWRFPDDVFKETVVFLMDNAHFLHMRTEILDKRRLLHRVRFHRQPDVN